MHGGRTIRKLNTERTRSELVGKLAWVQLISDKHKVQGRIVDVVTGKSGNLVSLRAALPSQQRLVDGNYYREWGLV
ncbi:MAG: hypothetical protein PVI97_00245 [Candidatus Thiodiazotropha sp.]|jgi:hypothetical protein